MHRSHKADDLSSTLRGTTRPSARWTGAATRPESNAGRRKPGEHQALCFLGARLTARHETLNLGIVVQVHGADPHNESIAQQAEHPVLTREDARSVLARFTNFDGMTVIPMFSFGLKFYGSGSLNSRLAHRSYPLQRVYRTDPHEYSQ